VINGVFLVIVGIWILVSQQVKYWAVLSGLGFKAETPLFFFQKDYLCFLVSWTLLLATLVLAFFQTLLSPWIQIIIILIISQITRKHARRRGCAKYRDTLKEMKEYHLSRGEDVSALDEQLNKSNRELLQQAYERAKLDI
jgi:hypothetical protein